jgi:DNA-binding CsgD family transcriptional regulator
MAESKSPLEHARASFSRRAWSDAFEALVSIEKGAPLDLADLERLVWSAALTGHDEVFVGALERLHKACTAALENKRAARAAFWLSFHLASFGSASAPGWLARANRLVENEPEPCAERGYLLLPMVERHLAAADAAAAEEVANNAARIGERCGDRDLVALARSLEARALLEQNRIEAGLSLLDEIMVAVTSGELSPLVTGIVYCSAIVRCQRVFALERAREWTAALTRWCNEQPQLVTFTGLCLVHRAEIMQLGGAWVEATNEVRQVSERRTNADPEVFGDACYQQAELLRLRGDLAEAERMYRLASENGCDPQPGLALLRLLQRQEEHAVNTIRRVFSTTTVRWRQARLLPAFIEIMLSAGHLDEARAGCRELQDIATEFGTEIIGAMAAQARGAVFVAEGNHRAAIEPLRHAFGTWQRAKAPYIAARIRVLLGRALFSLGDDDSAALERAAARKVFEELGAAPDLMALDAAHDAASMRHPSSSHNLSRRELEVLRLVATGKTNKAIARALSVSERTVDRHVSNIFTKIRVATRAAATAFAYENGLV